MALEMNDLYALKSMGNKDGLSAYEQVKLDYMAAKRPSNVAVTSIVFGGAALVGVIAGTVLNSMYANAKSKEAKEAAIASEKVANAQYNATLQLIAQGNANTKDNIDRLLLSIQRETDARVAQGTTISQTITDTISGQQQGSQSQSTSVENSAYATAMNQIVSDRLTGRSSLDAQPVCIYSAPQPCSCPGCGCGQ